MTAESNMATSNAFVSSDFSFKDSSTNVDVPITIHNPNHKPSVRVRDIEAERPQQGSRQRKNEFEPYLNGDITNISQFTAANIEYPKPTEIHNIEVENSDAMPEFFENGLLTPNDYITSRNAIIESYKANADHYLTVTSCKSKLPNLDLISLVKIHNFLESNKLINTINDPRRRIFDPFIESSPEAQILPHSQRDFKDINNVDLQYLKDLVYNPSSTKNVRKLWDISVEDPLNADNRKQYKCKTCDVDCSEIRYQSLKFKDVQTCIDCFLEGRFFASLSSGDFLRVDESATDLNMEEDWTDIEILKLLEGVDKYDDDWLLISEHVGSRTKEQCITQFLQLPINDEFLSTRPTKVELEEIPFGNTPNPVMSIISFLSGHVNSGVASAAAKSALQVLLKSDQENVVNIKDKDVEDTEMCDSFKKEEAGENMVTEDTKSNTNDVGIGNIVKLEETDITVPKESVKEENVSAFSKETMAKASIVALEGAVETARKLASYENEEIQHWARLAVKTTVEKLSLKLQQYDALETSLENEHEEMEKQAAVLANSIENLVSQYHPLMQPESSNSINNFNMP